MIVLSSIQAKELTELLLDGHVGVIPTDTIYGLVAAAQNKEAVDRLYGLKNRENKPGTVMAANIEQLVNIGVNEAVLKAVGYLWPNPISVVIPASPELGYLDLGLGDLAVRIPDNRELSKLLEMTGPLLTTSANHPGEVPASNIGQAQKYFSDAVDFYVEGGDLSGRAASTVVRLKDGRMEVLRYGAVTIDANGRII